MSASPQSPRRRHILASINSDRPRKRSRRVESEEELGPKPATASHNDAPPSGGPPAKEPRRGPLKLKDQKPRRDDGEEEPQDSHRSRHHHRRHHRHRRRHRSPTPPNPFEQAPLDPDAAFRESLFDAMADDEGASYWEGVYGQPVHVYPSERVGPTGELEQMTDNEYAAHVRRKMWEKTNAGLLEERVKREEARKMQQQEEKKLREEARQSRKLRDEMEQSLRRGEERRQKKQRADRWTEYIKGWADWDGTPETLPWPLESGRRKDINEKDVRVFFIQGLDLELAGEKTFVSKLRDERVRWHPDKVQQKLGGQVAEEIMRDVTAIFQIIDRLWGETRAKA